MHGTEIYDTIETSGRARRVRFEDRLPGMVWLLNIASSKREKLAKPKPKPRILHEGEIDLQDNLVRCSCADFRMRKAKHKPGMEDRRHHCKHIRAFMRWMRRHGLLRHVPGLIRACALCRTPRAEYELADDTGQHRHGHYICDPCVIALQEAEEEMRKFRRERKLCKK